ncbi:Hypothetical protein, putative [Bodo saltans]|uniref:Uncharacterized protein n=1 Tax=Bodo saltans TaxID=75058 RepID=A0A0S4J3U7_BODSA|nr:Hypothetical protein, putative [Bodo saltans]|eukprot:CUG74481.1 Hypothetical protein, putative [Bodo saltans]
MMPRGNANLARSIMFACAPDIRSISACREFNAWPSSVGPMFHPCCGGLASRSRALLHVGRIQESETRKMQTRSDVTVVTDSVMPESAVFNSILDAYESLRRKDPPRKSSDFRLSNEVQYNKKLIEDALFDGIRKQIALAKKGADALASEHFLIAVLGGPGLGKTDALHRIRRDRTLLCKIAAEINGSNDGQLRALHCVSLFASFDECKWSFNKDPYGADGPGLSAALCNMLLSDYLGVTFQKKMTRRCEGLTLQGLVEFVREREAGSRKCLPRDVCVVVLVDEVCRLSTERARLLCDELCAVQHVTMHSGLPMIAVAGALEVDSMFATVTRSSEHRLHPIPLRPCSSADIDDFVAKCCVAHKETKEYRIEWLTSRAHATKGNFELLADIWNAYPNRTPREEPHKYHTHPDDNPYAKEIVARQLLCTEQKCWMKEGDHIGGPFLEKSGHVTTLHDFASQTLGVYYKEVDLTKSPPMVWPCVVPLVYTKRHVSKSLQFAIQSFSDVRRFTECWAEALPQLEAVASSMMRTMSGDEPIRLERLYHGVFVQHWDAKSPVRLTFSKTCIDFRVRARYPTTKAPSVNYLIQYERGCDGHYTTHYNDKAIYYLEPSWINPALCNEETGQVPSAIGGAHTLLEAPTGVDGALKVVPVLTQLWLPSNGNVNEAELALLVNRAHGHATLKLALQPGSYYVALYVMSPMNGMGNTWKDSIPRGTIVIDAPSMERIMKPFGVDAEKLFECLRVT